MSSCLDNGPGLRTTTLGPLGESKPRFAYRNGESGPMSVRSLGLGGNGGVDDGGWKSLKKTK